MTHPLIQDMPAPTFARFNAPRSDLSAAEVQDCQAWARTHYTAGQPINQHWHPVVIAECVRINTVTLDDPDGLLCATRMMQDDD